MSSKPVYIQISEQIREEVQLLVAAGAERKLPTDRALEARYKVSRHTIGKALALLEAEGILSREQGRGTFIRASQSIPSGSALPVKRIGFIAPLASSTARGLCFHPVVQRIMLGVEHAARTSGCRVLTSVVGSHTASEERELFADLVATGVCGVILHPLLRRQKDIDADYLRSEFLDVPTVLAGGCLPYMGRAQIQLDNEKLGYDVMQWLLQQGHRKIGLVFPWSSDVVHPAFEERMLGFRRALKEHNVEPVEGWIQHDSGAGMAAALDACLRLTDPTAIITINDEAAIAVIGLLEGRGMWVPEQVTVIGFDNLPEATCFEPPFPTTNPDYQAMGALAAKTLLDALAAGTMPTGRIVLSVPLLFRTNVRARSLFGPGAARVVQG